MKGKNEKVFPEDKVKNKNNKKKKKINKEEYKKKTQEELDYLQKTFG